MNFDELIAKSYTGGEKVVAEKRSRAKDLETFLNIVRKINTSLVLSEVLELVIDEAIRITDAERGFLMLADKQGALRFVVGRDASGKSIKAEMFEVSSSVLDDVFSTGESICIENALRDERFERRQSILNLELQTIICTPLRTQNETIGLIYVDSKYIHAMGRAETLNIFEILAGHAAIAIKNAGLYENLNKAYTDLKQANEQIIKFERMALKGELAAEVSHELKNLVAVVLLNLQVLHRRLPKVSPEDVMAIVEKTIAGTKKIQGFSQNLLTRSHIAANLTPAHPNKLLQDFAEFVRVLPRFKNNEIIVSLGENVREMPMDVDQMQQVLLNLVNNAVEAQSTVSIELGSELRDGHTILYVRDNGPGILEEIRERLFQEKITTKIDGNGYGLRICAQIVEHHNGTISLESSMGKGTTFVMKFPAGPSR